jgi:arylsulfatase A-like enzyme
VVSLDTTRADAVAGLPVWSRLAREGTSFSQAIAAAPITEPSHLALFTGIAPFRSGIVSNGTVLGDRPLVWKDLQAAGWLTAGFVSGFPLHSRYGWAQGMSVYDDDFGAWPGAESLTLVKGWNQVAVKEHALRERDAGRVLTRAERWLRAHREETFFAFVHFYDAHGPYVSGENGALGPPPTDGAPLALPPYWPAAHRRITSTDWLRRAYEGEVRTVDTAVGRLLDALGDRLDDTVVIVTADHGESLTEHGYLFDHGDDLYDPSLRVPLVVRWPGKVRAGAVVDCQVGGVDVAPTLRELVGLGEGPAGSDGVSRAAELRGEPCRDTPVVASTTAGRFVEKPPVDHALRGQGFKLIDHEAGVDEAFDLTADPGELAPLAPSAELDEQRAAFARVLQTGASPASPDLDAETRRALEQLGYVDPAGAP